MKIHKAFAFIVFAAVIEAFVTLGLGGKYGFLREVLPRRPKEPLFEESVSYHPEPQRQGKPWR